MLRPGETAIPPTAALKRKIAEHAHKGGGIHRMNVPTNHTLYEFTCFKDESGKIDFVGGWTGRGSVTTAFMGVYVPGSPSRFYTTAYFIRRFQR